MGMPEVRNGVKALFHSETSNFMGRKMLLIKKRRFSRQLSLITYRMRNLFKIVKTL